LCEGRHAETLSWFRIGGVQACRRLTFYLHSISRTLVEICEGGLKRTGPHHSLLGIPRPVRSRMCESTSCALSPAISKVALSDHAGFREIRLDLISEFQTLSLHAGSDFPLLSCDVGHCDVLQSGRLWIG
jgi:hypothetical protein